MTLHMVNRILEKAEQGETLCRKDIRSLLSSSDQAALSRLFAAARETRQTWFGDNIFLYGFLYFSTHCRNNCRFCHYRRDNKELQRYRKTLPEILNAAGEMARTGVHLIDLTMGEDPEFYRTGFKSLINLVQAVKREAGLPVMISPGVVPEHVIREFALAGVQWLACYQETHNRDLYAKLRRGQDYDRRMDVKKIAAKMGMLVEEGLLTGVGENLDDLADSIICMRDLPWDQVRAMTFVPQSGTPMAHLPAVSRLLERKVIAVMRLAMPDRLIPASLDVDGLDGLKERLDAGANVVSSIVPPERGLAGVANNALDIEDARRSVDHVAKILLVCGLTVAPGSLYQEWIDRRREAKAQCRATDAA